MRKETISSRQAMCILVMFLFGSSVVIGINSEAGQDSWMSLLIGMCMSLVIVTVYARVMRLFPEADLFDALQLLFGKVFGRVFVALITWYALHLGALVIRNYSEFVQVVTMPETPQLPIMASMMLVTAYLAISGMETLGKWSVCALFPVLLIVLFTLVLALNRIEFFNLEPFLVTKPAQLLSAGFSVFSFPFAETVLFLCMAGAIRKEDNPYKIYTYSVLFGGVILMLVMLRNITTLGMPMVRSSYFPSYTTARILKLGDFLSRIEGSISMNFLVAGITKITLCLMAAAKGMAHLFGMRDYRHILFPTGIAMMALCAIVYSNTMEMFGFLPYYKVYALPFQVAIPVLVWVVAEIRFRRRKPALRPGS